MTAPSGRAPVRGASPHRRSSNGLWFRAPTLGRTVGVEIALTAVCAVAVLTDIQTRVVLGVALPLAVLPFVTVAGRTSLDWIHTAFRYLTGWVPAPGTTVDHAQGVENVYGVHWSGDRVSCVLELRPPAGTSTELGRSRARVDVALDLTTIARCLTQHDIAVDEIAVVSHGSRTSSGSPATEVYERLIGPLPAVAVRTVWVTVAVDVRTNGAAIEARGGGRAGASRTVLIAGERVARALESDGISSIMLSRSRIQSAASHQCRGVPYESLTESWTSAALPGVIDTGFGFDCRKIDNEVLADLWSTPALSTTTVLRLTPHRTAGHVFMSGSCNFVTRTARPSPRLPGAISMNGRQRQALLTSLPLGITAAGYADPAHRIGYEDASTLALPTAGCGQLLGSNASGHGVAMSVFGAGLGSVLVSGELYLAQQLAFRAIAVGARVLVRTDRPHAWGPLVDSVATPDRLRIDGGPHRSSSRIDLVVRDFSDAVDAPGGPGTDTATVLTLTEHLPRTPMTDPDLSIIQPGAAGDRIHVRTSRDDIELVLVTIPQETAFIGHPRSVRHPTAAH
ncbi:type VII secretion protein EccE [Rhodococcus sp. G-MC3]|uniref:type VII secretion protein EccE n=1 Tax=Rhodococcus sp. G-MC3 TaxID=3046209 RepID=UPI0024B936FF|nr:type VII secretion protein EccE [Rhodococcus sp. G-MC3]MDJ0392733.1 type VII secretion protein EccE [Rhodococcus sp. G-MC3]